MKRILMIVLLLGFSFYASAQVGGRGTYQFLNLPINPQIGALGGKNITVQSDNPTNALSNPSLLDSLMAKQVSVNYMNYIADINYGTAAYAHHFGEKYGTFQAGLTYIDYGSFDGFDEQGNATNSFGGNETAFSVGYAYKIPSSNFFVGANLKFITSRLEQYSSLGLATDLGITYVNPETKWVASAVLRNAGRQITAFDEVTENLPLELIIGLSKQLEKVPIRWHLTLENMQQWDVAFSNPALDETDLEGNVSVDNPSAINNALRHVIIGAELFPDSGFSPRIGYSFRRSEELSVADQRSFAGLTFGFMVKFNKVRFSYTFMRYNQAASSSFFGLDLNLM